MANKSDGGPTTQKRWTPKTKDRAHKKSTKNLKQKNVGRSSLEKLNDPIVRNVVGKFAQRSQKGMEVYGVTLDREDFSSMDRLTNIEEETMDGMNYI